MPCSNAAKTRNQLKFAGVPQTGQPISAAIGWRSPYCGDMWRTYCCLTRYFPILDTCLSWEDSARQRCDGAQMAIFGDFFASCVFSEPRAAGFRTASEICTKATSCIHCAIAEIRQGKKKTRRKNKKPQGKNIMYASAMQGGHKNDKTQSRELLGLFMCVHCTVHNCCTQYCTEQTW